MGWHFYFSLTSGTIARSGQPLNTFFWIIPYLHLCNISTSFT